jgi:hypothetical protein
MVEHIIVDVDGLPVEVSRIKWDADPEAYADEIRARRRGDDPPQGDTGERPTSFDDVTREHGEP